MKLAAVSLLLVLGLNATFAAEESCLGRCSTFNPGKKCQCDSMCHYYRSCCEDFNTVCPKKIARGDVFDIPEDYTVEMPNPEAVGPTFLPTSNTMAPPPPTTHVPTPPLPNPQAVGPTFSPTSNTIAPQPQTTHAPTSPPDPDAAPCSGRPFDAFLQLKNGSIYAFRGEYFFELDDSSVLPGYPKLIKDVWGIPGPIDAAFTRINCLGKTYIFKGNRYWRFEGDVLDEDFPRDISVGFEGMPNDVDAAFAVPAPSLNGKEKVYFFKGNQYYQYEFKHQPAHGECVRKLSSSQSVMFTRYTDLYCDETWEDVFTQLFGGSFGGHKGPRSISRDWAGIKPRVDAAMVGLLHLSPAATAPPSQAPTARRSRTKQRRRPNKRQHQRGRHTRSLSGFLGDIFNLDYDLFGDYNDYDYSDVVMDPTPQRIKSTPVQNVYFFQKDKYYRVDLQTKRMDNVSPPYPRSIAKYWLGCQREEPLHESRAEKR